MCARFGLEKFCAYMSISLKCVCSTDLVKFSELKLGGHFPESQSVSDKEKKKKNVSDPCPPAD